MNYNSVVSITQSLALVFFMVIFIGVVAYVFWPGNKRKFDDAARLPFEDETAADKKRKG